MAKAFKIIAQNNVYEFTARQYGDAASMASRASQIEGSEYFLKNVGVSCAEFIEACYAGIDAWYAKKEITHKRVSVQHGVLPTSRVTIWVKK